MPKQNQISHFECKNKDFLNDFFDLYCEILPEVDVPTEFPFSRSRVYKQSCYFS